MTWTPPKVKRRCDDCGGLTNSSRRRYCDVCLPRGGAPAWVRTLEAIVDGRDAGLAADEVADRLGQSAAVLERRAYRHGAVEVAHWFGAAARAERRARQAAA